MLKKRLFSFVLMLALTVAFVPCMPRHALAASPVWPGWEDWEYAGQDTVYRHYVYPYMEFTSDVYKYPRKDADEETVEYHIIKMIMECIQAEREGSVYATRSIVFEYTDSSTASNISTAEENKLRRMFADLVYTGLFLIDIDDTAPYAKKSIVVSCGSHYNPEVFDRLVSIAEAAKAYSSKVIGQLEYINKYLIDNVEYYLEGWGQSTEETLIDGRAVCGGYTNTVNDLCFLLGIPSVSLYGTGFYNHVWNGVYVDGKWKMLDVSENDDSGRSKAYFLVDSHAAQDPVLLGENADEFIAKDFAIKIHKFIKDNNSIATPRPPKLTAVPTSSIVLVNNTPVSFDAYNINDNNYFKLRDLAYVLSSTEKQFEVAFDSTGNAIILTSGKPYTPVGGEMQSRSTGSKTPTATTSKILLDGNVITLTAYNIDGNNYFKLRDIGQAFDFGVDWDGFANTIIIDTGKRYIAD